MKYFLIAGEASGDLHASKLMHELKNKDANAEFCFLGGDLMAQQGGKMIRHYRQMAFMGFIAVVKNIKTVLKNIDDCKTAIQQFQPDVLILIDYPSFNLRIAEYVKNNTEIPVFYYIAPKLWAWKEYRIKAIKKYVDQVFTIFPFETEFYKKHDYQVEYVGNPTQDSVAELCDRNESFEEFIKRHRLTSKAKIAILPGSRRQEITACLPKMIAAAQQFKDFQILIAGAPGIEPDFYQQFLTDKSQPIIFDNTYQLLLHSKAAIVNSGTATLETALIGTPQVVVYHVFGGRISYFLKELIIKTKYISLVNIIAQKESVKELILHLFTIENIKNELQKLLFDNNYIDKIKNEYKNIGLNLGNNRAAKTTAEHIFNHISKHINKKS